MTDENFEKKYDYDFTKSINIYEIASKENEVKEAFDFFLKSVRDIFSFEGRKRVDGANDYGYFVYRVMEMNERVKNEQTIDKDRENTISIPEKFFDLLLIDEHNKTAMMRKDAELTAATKEILQMVANYIAHKYKKPTRVSFDSLFFTEKYIMNPKNKTI